MFATAITASLLAQPDIRSRSRSPAVLLGVRLAAALSNRRQVDGVHQLPRGRQPLNREPIGGGRHTAVGPFLGHGDPPPPPTSHTKNRPTRLCCVNNSTKR